jgi:sorbose reductase
METVRTLLEHGASGVAIFDVPASFTMSNEKIDALRAEFPNAKVINKTVDVTDEKVVDSVTEEAAKELGSIDVLVCLAGIVSTQHAVDVSSSSWRRVLEVNTTGAWFCAQSASKFVIKSFEIP